MHLNLKALRKAAGYRSAGDFAEVLGFPERTYRNYEQGIRGINLDLACEFADALGCTLDELAGRVPVQTSQGEKELAACYRACTPARQERLLHDARDFACLSKNEGYAVSALVA